MSCAPSDLRDYYFDALGPVESQQVKEHVQRCEKCSAEIEQLRLTALALEALPAEEIPRRIAFVSDKVFQPSPVVRWWQAIWLSGVRTAAVAAMVLAAALVVHAYRVAPAVQTVKVVERVAGTLDPGVIQAAVDRAVAKAVADSEARFDVKLKQVVDQNDREKRQTMERVAEVLDTMDRRSRVMTVASNALLETGQ